MVDSSDTLPPKADRLNAPEVIQALETDVGRGLDIRTNEQGEEVLYVAVLIQREIQVTGILRLGLPMEPTMQAAERSLLGDPLPAGFACLSMQAVLYWPRLCVLERALNQASGWRVGRPVILRGRTLCPR